MILSSAREFERFSNPEIQERPSDNVEVPQVKYTSINTKLNKIISLIVMYYIFFV